LKEIDFSHNEIQFIGYNLLNGLHKLISVDFRSNPGINIWYDEDRDNDEKLREVKRKIRMLPEHHEEAEKSPMDQNFKTYEVQEKNIPKKLTEKNHLKFTKKLHSDLEMFLLREDLKDFTIKINDTHFKVHKLLLMMRSEFFAELFKQKPNISELILDELILVKIFEKILKYLYTDESPNDPKTAKEIFTAAGQLKIKSLMEISAQNLIEDFKLGKSLKELWEIFNLGVKYDHEELKLKTFEEIKKNFPDGHLKDDMMEHPWKLSEIIEAKFKLDELMEK
jgi:Leucine-rich repeat (LRR) protein